MIHADVNFREGTLSGSVIEANVAGLWYGRPLRTTM